MLIQNEFEVVVSAAESPRAGTNKCRTCFWSATIIAMRSRTSWV